MMTQRRLGRVATTVLAASLTSAGVAAITLSAVARSLPPSDGAHGLSFVELLQDPFIRAAALVSGGLCAVLFAAATLFVLRKVPLGLSLVRLSLATLAAAVLCWPMVPTLSVVIIPGGALLVAALMLTWEWANAEFRGTTTTCSDGSAA